MAYVLLCNVKNIEVGQLKNTKVRLIVFITIPVVLVSLLVIVLYFVSNADTYENIKIFEINGEVVIERKSKEKVDTYENMNLMSGDIISVLANSNAKLQLDDDKFALLEPNTKVEIESVDLENKKFKINLITGAIITEIRNKLDSKSSFDICTPNSTMSVRGTVFRVEVLKDENGKYVTNVQVYEGKVEVNINNKENSTIFVENGKSAQIIGNNGNAEYEYTNRDLDISSLPDCSLIYLKKISDGGRELTLNTTLVVETTDVTETTDIDAITDADKNVETSTNKVTDNNSNGSSTENDETKAIDSNVQVPVNTEVQQETKPPVETSATQAPVIGNTKVTVIYNFTELNKVIQLKYNYGDTIEPIAVPVVSTSIKLEGWYTDSSFINEWDFSQPVTQDMVLYAKCVPE